MIRWFFLFISILVIQAQGFASPMPASPTASGVKGFQEWKSEKVQAALNQMSLTKLQIQKSQAEGNKRNSESLEKQYDQLKWNLEVAQDLSVTDYFVLYLSQQSQSDRFYQAALKLSTREVAQMMEAYANSLGKAPADSVVRPIKQTAIPARIPVQAIQNPYQFK